MVANNFEIDEPSRDRNDLDAFYNKHPMLRRMMQAVTVDQIGIDLGGLNLRGRNHYTCECLSIVYLILFVILISVDLNIMGPVFNGEVVSIDLD